MGEFDFKSKNESEYKRATNAFFYASIIMIPIFALPAFLALFLGRYLDNYFGSGFLITLIFLISSFIFSWVWVWKKNKELTQNYRKIRIEMDNKDMK